MGRQADRIEEDLDFIGVETPLEYEGSMTYRTDLGRFRMRDELGEYDPRESLPVPGEAGEVLYATTAGSFEKVLPLVNSSEATLLFCDGAKLVVKG